MLQVRSDLRHRCLEALAEDSLTGQRARTMREQAEALAAQVRNAELALESSEHSSSSAAHSKQTAPAQGAPSPEQTRGMRNRVEYLRKQSDDLLREAAAGVLQNVQVVACTCAGELSRSRCMLANNTYITQRQKSKANIVH